MTKYAYYCIIKYMGAESKANPYDLFGIEAAIRIKEKLGGADIIICGKQTTDSDTAQIGPAIAEHLHLPHAP